jgi:hypothetical protein
VQGTRTVTAHPCIRLSSSSLSKYLLRQRRGAVMKKLIWACVITFCTLLAVTPTASSAAGGKHGKRASSAFDSSQNKAMAGTCSISCGNGSSTETFATNEMDCACQCAGFCGGPCTATSETLSAHCE